MGFAVIDYGHVVSLARAVNVCAKIDAYAALMTNGATGSECQGEMREESRLK